MAFLAAGGTAVAAAGLMFVVHWLLPKKICTRKGTTSEVGIEEIPDQHELEEGQGFSTRSVGKINYAMDGDRKGKTSEVGIEEIPDQHEPEAPTTPNVGKINYAMDGDRKGKTSEVGIEKIPDQHEPEAPTTPNIGKINYAMDGDLTSTDDSSIVKAPPFLNGHAGGPAEKASCPKDETVLPKTMAVDVQLNHISIDEKNLSGASS